jgi:hypothetical protein
VSLEGDYHELDSKFHYQLVTNVEGASFDQKFLEKEPSKLGLIVLGVWSKAGL